ncbi:MAG: hypothetical protein IJJ15_08930 [Ruminococcus sp.]|nr:hypothetical protein [Ruminococcus sp.]
MTGCFSESIFSVIEYPLGLLFGALSEGLDGDHSILLAKSIPDLFTVMAIGYNILAGQLHLKKIRVLNIVLALPPALFFTWAASLLPIAICFHKRDYLC